MKQGEAERFGEEDAMEVGEDAAQRSRAFGGGEASSSTGGAGRVDGRREARDAWQRRAGAAVGEANEWGHIFVIESMQGAAGRGVCDATAQAPEAFAREGSGALAQQEAEEDGGGREERGSDAGDLDSEDVCARHPERFKKANMPSAEELREHELMHLPCRSWCKVCVPRRSRERSRLHMDLAYLPEADGTGGRIMW